MPASDRQIVVLVHGWSVRNTQTYGQLPARLRREARRRGLALDVRNIWLSKYISFHNEVRLEDISEAFEAALRRELGAELDAGRRFAVITHSTGGPVIRDWLQREYLRTGRKTCPVSHLIMLAPANFGSALAQLGKTRIARLKAWFEGVEPGLGVLDWLELGSPESWELNLEWLKRGARLMSARGVWPFVITGQTIDRKAYDHVNSYTGELGSDGVVRAAAANLNFAYVKLIQRSPGPDAPPDYLPLAARRPAMAPQVAFTLAAGRSHSGDEFGIMRSVRDDDAPHPTVEAVVDCLGVHSARDYAQAVARFEKRTAEVLEQELVERVDLPGPFERTEIHDPCAQLIFRVRDDRGLVVKDFDLMFTAGDDDNPDRLPPGFFIDRQKNHRDAGTLTYYVNYARMLGSPAIERNGETVRRALPGAEGLGLRIVPYPLDGFVHYLPGVLKVSTANLKRIVRPHQTTLVDIVLHRVVREGVFRLSKRDGEDDFTKQPPGKPIGS